MEKNHYGSFRPTEEVFAAWDVVDMIAQALGTRMVLFQTPSRLSPSQDNKRNLRAFFKKIDRRDCLKPQCMPAWTGEWRCRKKEKDRKLPVSGPPRGRCCTRCVTLSIAIRKHIGRDVPLDASSGRNFRKPRLDEGGPDAKPARCSPYAIPLFGRSVPSAPGRVVRRSG